MKKNIINQTLENGQQVDPPPLTTKLENNGRKEYANAGVSSGLRGIEQRLELRVEGEGVGAVDDASAHVRPEIELAHVVYTEHRLVAFNYRWQLGLVGLGCIEER